MRVSYEWLKEIVPVAATPEEVAEKLTMIGLEVEGSESIDGDTVFEVNVTPNRPDCLSIIGIARELSASFRVPLKIPEHTVGGEQPVSDFAVEILNPELCNRYAGRVITDVSIGSSPEWMRSRLEKCGIRSINNVVDVTNYVLLEFGHPLHAFDADKLEGKKIMVGTPGTVTGARAKIRTLDGVDREIPSDSLLIWDAQRPVAVAGVMGGSYTEVTEKTANIFLESAYFAPLSVRRTSKTLSLSSESSYRFERGSDIVFLEKALDRAALLIRNLAGGTIHEIVDAYPVKYVPQPFEVRQEKINRILGTALSPGIMRSIMNDLGIPTEDKGDGFAVFPPAHRRDLEREHDVAEEIARIFGYNSVLTTMPRSPLSSGGLSGRGMGLNRIRESMRKAGFSEVINYSFMNSASLDLFSIPDDDRRRNTILIRNPLSQDEGCLRTTLAPALINNLVYNFGRGLRNVQVFEIARLFFDIGEALPAEELWLGGILYIDKSPALWKEETPAFYLAKGALQSLFEEVRLEDVQFVPSGERFLHKGQSADVFIGDSRAGYLGILSPEVVEKLDLRKHKPEVMLFELSLDRLLSEIPEAIRYRPIPKYPSVERDIALVVEETLPARTIQEMIRSFPSDLIEDVSIFDSYKGKNIPEGKKSLAFGIVYRSSERTLTVEEVENLHSSLVDYLLRKTGGEIRK
ncbi:MAG: phenylalanine--tRNA ligase subunit beta [Nitrospirota bacterium]